VLRPVNISSTVVISLNAAINGVGMALAHTSLFEDRVSGLGILFGPMTVRSRCGSDIS
jgi:hypothetical protein